MDVNSYFAQLWSFMNLKIFLQYTFKSLSVVYIKFPPNNSGECNFVNLLKIPRERILKLEIHKEFAGVTTPFTPPLLPSISYHPFTQFVSPSIHPFTYFLFLLPHTYYQLVLWQHCHSSPHHAVARGIQLCMLRDGRDGCFSGMGMVLFPCYTTSFSSLHAVLLHQRTVKRGSNGGVTSPLPCA